VLDGPTCKRQKKKEKKRWSGEGHQLSFSNIAQREQLTGSPEFSMDEGQQLSFSNIAQQDQLQIGSPEFSVVSEYC
jgi:hypothetical protein